MLNLEQHTENTLDNLDNVIKLFEEKLFNLNNFKKYINKKNFKDRVLLLGGGQISGSLSPFMHTFSSYDKNGKDFLYTLINLDDENISIEKLLEYIEKEDNILGANVTMPYKIDVFDIFEKENKLDKSAILVGAVNTITKEDNTIKGLNTDMEGIKQPLLDKLGEDKIKSIKNGYVLGAGGAAKAAVGALLSLGITNIKVFNRNDGYELLSHFTSEKVRDILLEKYGIIEINIENIEYDVIYENINKISDNISEKGILINTLPFGFKDELPKKPITDIEFEEIKGNIELYFDVVYDMNHGDTPLITKFKQNDIPTADGRDMVINQAVKGFNSWTNGEAFKKEKIEKIFRK